MHIPKHKILCVDDHQDSLDLLKIWLEENDFEVVTCDSYESCLSEIARGKLSALILDNYLKEKTGAEMCGQIRSIKPQLPIVIYSGEARPAEIEKALSAGADAYLIKPTGFDELVPVTLKLIEEYQSETSEAPEKK